MIWLNFIWPLWGFVETFGRFVPLCYFSLFLWDAEFPANCRLKQMTVRFSEESSPSRAQNCSMGPNNWHDFSVFCFEVGGAHVSTYVPCSPGLRVLRTRFKCNFLPASQQVDLSDRSNLPNWHRSLLYLQAVSQRQDWTGNKEGRNLDIRVFDVKNEFVTSNERCLNSIFCASLASRLYLQRQTHPKGASPIKTHGSQLHSNLRLLLGRSHSFLPNLPKNTDLRLDFSIQCGVLLVVCDVTWQKCSASPTHLRAMGPGTPWPPKLIFGGWSQQPPKGWVPKS